MIDDKAERIRTLHSLLKELPKENYDLLTILMKHLHKYVAIADGHRRSMDERALVCVL